MLKCEKDRSEHKAPVGIEVESGHKIKGLNYSNFEEFIGDLLLFIKQFLYSSDFTKIIQFISSKIPGFFDKYPKFKLFIYKIQFFHHILLDRNKNELSQLYETNIYPLIVNDPNFATIKENLVKLSENPEMIKSRSYQQAWEECCKLFQTGIEIAIIEIFDPEKTFLVTGHDCIGPQCEKCLDRKIYEEKKSKMDTIEAEIIRLYRDRRRKEKAYEYTSSSDEDKQCNNFDFFLNSFSKQFSGNNVSSLPFEEDNLVLMEVSDDEKSKYNLPSKMPIDDNEQLSHSPTFDTYDEKQRRSLIKQLNRHNQSIKKGKLKEFQFKFTKRENIDKKILRKFRKYLKDKFKKKDEEVNLIISANKFWYHFINQNLLPPFVYEVEEKEFKSFNTGYMCWVFEHNAADELYNLFIKVHYEKLMAHFETKYKLNPKEEEYNLLKNYLNTLPAIFGNSTDYIFDVDPKKAYHEVESTSSSVNNDYLGHGDNFVSLRPQIPDIFSELINYNSMTPYSKSFGYAERKETISDDKSNEYDENKEEFETDND